MDDRTDSRFEEVLPVQLYAKTELSKDELTTLVTLDPYNLEQDRERLKKAGVVFFRDGSNLSGAVFDTSFTGLAFYSQVYAKDGAVSNWFMVNQRRVIVQIKKESVSFKF